MTRTVSTFHELFPDGTLLSVGDRDAAAAVLHQAGLDTIGNVIAVERGGEGNMNLVLRVTTDRSPFIVKQARPWVEKYPSIDAPPERVRVEAAFYAAIRGVEGVQDRMPGLRGLAEQSAALVLEDLGDATDLSGCYDGEPLDALSMHWIARYLAWLHRVRVEDELLRNRAMRKLNHAHIFDLPLTAINEERLDAVTPGLSRKARTLAADRLFVDAVAELGRRYLDDTDTLLHGDIHPGSVLRTERGLRVIDPEFAFGGPPTFDLGVLVAHAILSGHEARDAARVLHIYTEAGGSADADDALRFAGVEIMRRLIGVAQLPLSAGLDAKEVWLDLARATVLGRL